MPMATGASSALADEETKRDAVMRYLRAAAANSRAGVRERPFPLLPSNDNLLNDLARATVAHAAAIPSGSGIGDDIASIPGSLLELLNFIGEESRTGPFGTEQTGPFATPDPLKLGETLYDVGKQSVQGAIHDWTHPGEYFSEHPGFALMDLIGLAAGGAGIARRAASMADNAIPQAARFGGYGLTPDVEVVPTPRWPLSTVRDRLNAGDVGDIMSLRPYAKDPSFRDLIGSSAASPDLGSMRYPDELVEYPVLLKRVDPSGTDVFRAQGNAEITASRLNKLTGGRVVMPGMAEARGPYTPWYRKGDSPASTRMGEDLTVVEFLSGSKKAEGLGDLAADPQTIHELRAMQIFDRIVGNRDRGWGHNIMATAEGRPLAIDFGLAFQAADDYQMGFFDPRTWGALGGPETAGLRPGQLSPAEIQWIQRIKHVLEHPTPAMVGGAGLQGLGYAANRAQKMIDAGEFVSYGKGGWGRNFTRNNSMDDIVVGGRIHGQPAPAVGVGAGGHAPTFIPDSWDNNIDRSPSELSFETRDREWNDWAIANPTEADLLEQIGNAPAPDLAKLDLPQGMRRPQAGVDPDVMGMLDLDFGQSLVVFDGYEWQRLNEIDLRMIAEGETPPWFAKDPGSQTERLRGLVGGGEALADHIRRIADVEESPLASPSPAPGDATRLRHQEELNQVIQNLIQRNRERTMASEGTSTLWNKIVAQEPDAPGLGIMDATALLDAIRRASSRSGSS